MSSVSGARIFAVDDNEANILLLDRLLARAGYGSVRTFRNAQAMLDAMEGDEPDLILLDLHMPPPDGFAVLAALRERATDGDFPPVIVLTADGERPSRARALADGASDFLVKPFDAEEVLLRVRNLIERRLLFQAARARNLDLAAEVEARTADLHETETGWSSVVDSLSRLTALGTPEETADAICEALITLPDLAVVGVLAFGPNDTTIPLAARPAVIAPFAINRPMPAEWSRAIRERVADGPWLGDWARFSGGTLPQVLDREVSAVAMVPMRTGDGTLGVLAAASTVREGMGRLGRRLAALEAFGALAGALLGPGIRQRQRDDIVREQIDRVIDTRAFAPVFQPIVALDAGTVVGHEALTRFTDRTPPDRRFGDAAAVGLGLDLELAAVEAAVEQGGRLGRGTWLSLNVSPGVILEQGRLADVLVRAPVPVVLEITEHTRIEDYAGLRTAIASFGPAVRCAIDDAGAGFSSFRHILELGPHLVKLDVGLVRSIERDPARQALIAGMVYFALRTGCTLIAEGIETPAERDALRELGVELGQGYLFGRPEPADAAGAGSPPAPDATADADAGTAPVRRWAARRRGHSPRGAGSPS